VAASGLGGQFRDNFGEFANVNEYNRVKLVQAGGVEALYAMLREGTQEARVSADRALQWVVRVEKDSPVRVSDVRVIEALVATLRDGTDGKAAAATVLWLFCVNADARVEIVAAGGGGGTDCISAGWDAGGRGATDPDT
jgi:hypothetical protein